MKLKKLLNLNTYEWWRNHRRFVTLGLFIVIFGAYINPVVKESKDKIICARFGAGNISVRQGYKKLGLNTANESIASYCAYYK